jgi:hypothetical protein
MSTALEATPLWPLLVELADNEPRTASELLNELENRADDAVRGRKQWPSARHVLSGLLKRLAPSLRDAGIEIEFGSHGRGNGRRKTITIWSTTEISDPSDPSDNAQCLRGISGSQAAVTATTEPSTSDPGVAPGVAWGRVGKATNPQH